MNQIVTALSEFEVIEMQEKANRRIIRSGPSEVGVIQSTWQSSNNEFLGLGKATQEAAFDLMAKSKTPHELFTALYRDIDFRESFHYQSFVEFKQVVDLVMFYYIDQEMMVK